MKALTLILSCAFLSTFCGTSKAEANQIQWLTNYDEAVKISQSTSKPMLLFFTGSEGCTWCIKLEKESLHTPEFAQTVGDKFVFVKLDFPLNRINEASAQNKRLQQQFDITGFPVIILLDSHQKKIGQTGYRPGGGKQYAQHLLKMLEEHTAYREKLDKLDQPGNISGLDLRTLYAQAIELQRDADAAHIAELGINSDQKHFFLLERYRQLIGQGQTENAQQIKQQLLAADPQNFKLVQYQMALIDFEATCRNTADTPEHAVASLVEYIHRFGEQDKDHQWRLQMLISQVFFEKEKFSEALQYAQSSYQSAPETAQPEIATAIHNIEANITTH